MLGNGQVLQSIFLARQWEIHWYFTTSCQFQQLRIVQALCWPNAAPLTPMLCERLIWCFKDIISSRSFVSKPWKSKHSFSSDETKISNLQWHLDSWSCIHAPQHHDRSERMGLHRCGDSCTLSWVLCSSLSGELLRGSRINSGNSQIKELTFMEVMLHKLQIIGHASECRIMDLYFDRRKGCSVFYSSTKREVCRGSNALISKILFMGEKNLYADEFCS